MTIRLPSVCLAALLMTACGTTPLADDAAESTTSVVVLRHTDAFQMRDTINQFLADARASGEPLADVRVADNSQNTLLVEGTPKQVKQILRLIENVDKERPQ